jgi:hypothetical protein
VYDGQQVVVRRRIRRVLRQTRLDQPLGSIHVS